MFADIAILAATTDLWSKYGAQNDPFPIVTYPDWHTLVWESIHHNGNGCDYISEKIINESTVANGVLSYGPRKYKSIFSHTPRIRGLDYIHPEFLLFLLL